MVGLKAHCYTKNVIALWDFPQNCNYCLIFKSIFHNATFIITNFQLILSVCFVNAMIFSITLPTSVTASNQPDPVTVFSSSNVPVTSSSSSSKSSTSDLICNICYFKVASSNGHKIHKGRKHHNVSQLDGWRLVGQELPTLPEILPILCGCPFRH